MRHVCQVILTLTLASCGGSKPTSGSTATPIAEAAPSETAAAGSVSTSPTEPPPESRKCVPATYWAASYDQCEQQCKSGVAEACGLAAKMHWGSDRVVGDERGFSLSERGCDLGSGASCGQASSFHQLGRHGVVNAEKSTEYGLRAVKLFDKECEAGNAYSCDQLGWWYSNGYSVDRDKKRAAELTDRGSRLMKAACEAGDGRSCASRALDIKVNLTDFSDVAASVTATASADDKVMAANLYMRGCDLGYMPACVEYSAAIAKSDKAKSLLLLKRACEQGLGDACYRRASGLYGTPEYKHFCRLGCERFDAKSCIEIGRADLACKYGRKHYCEESASKSKAKP